MSDDKSAETLYKVEVQLVRARFHSSAKYFQILSEMSFPFPVGTMIKELREARESVASQLESDISRQKANKLRDMLPLSEIDGLSRKQVVEKCIKMRAFVLEVQDEFNRDPSLYVDKPKKLTAEEERTQYGLDIVEIICKGFSAAVIDLRTRHGDRKPLEITDEYDVQYLMTLLLRPHFSDLRREERTPSLGGGSGQMDFMMKPERIVLETKMTRENLGAVALRRQLVDDIALYGSHPDCGALICFVYDPAGRIDNAAGFISDMEKLPAKMNVRVFIER